MIALFIISLPSAALLAIGSNLQALTVLELAGCVRIGDSGLVAVAQGTLHVFFFWVKEAQIVETKTPPALCSVAYLRGWLLCQRQ
mgnify:CR=1 FL=1